METLGLSRAKKDDQLSRRELACALSHIECISSWARSEDDRHLLIVEDDTLFLENTEKHFLTAVERAGSDWDFIFPEIYFGAFLGVPGMSRGDQQRYAAIRLFSEMYYLRRMAAKDNNIILYPLQNNHLWGACAYLINANRKKHVLEALGKYFPLSLPIDIIYGDMFLKNHINAYVTFPYLTKPSDDCFRSNLSPNAWTECIFDAALRRHILGLHEDVDAFLKMMNPITEKFFGSLPNNGIQEFISGYVPLLITYFLR